MPVKFNSGLNHLLPDPFLSKGNNIVKPKIKTSFGSRAEAEAATRPPYSLDQQRAAKAWLSANKKLLDDLDKKTGPSGNNKVSAPGATDDVVEDTSGVTTQSAEDAYYAKLEADKAAEKAASDARKKAHRTQAGGLIDELIKIYEELVANIDTTGNDKYKRIVSDFGSKIQEQIEMLDEAKYNVDANAAASGLADSSFRSLDRQKVKNASDKNIDTLNTAKTDSLSELGKTIAEAKSKYVGAGNVLKNTTKPLLDKTEDESELLRGIGSLGQEKESAISAKASYQPSGAFVDTIEKIGNPDNTALGNILDSISNNGNASAGTKNSTIKSLIEGSNVSQEEKDKLKNKYIQQGV